MIEFTSISHHIQKHIIDVLLYKKVARFRDLRPPKVDTNLFSYHLTCLIRSQLVEKVAGGYALSPAGLSYVDRVSSQSKTIRTQPKIITMLVVQNSDGDVLLQRRTKQPYIDTWTLPYGKLHIEDASVKQAACREAFEKLGLERSVSQGLVHAGDCYIRVRVAGSREAVLSTTLAHVFRLETDAVTPTDTLLWAQPHTISKLPLAPAVEAIMTRVFFRDPSFFEEYDCEYTTMGL